MRVRHTPAPAAIAGQERQAAYGPLAVALALLRAGAPKQVIDTPAAWPRWAVLLPHVLAATSYPDRAAAPPAAVMEDASWLLDRATHYLWVHARPGEAKILLERALAIDEAAYGPDHPTVAARLNNLATILRDLGRPWRGPATARTRPGHHRSRLRPRPPHRRHRPERSCPDPAGPGAARGGPATAGTRPGHHRSRLRPRPPHRRHPLEQPRHDPAGPGAAGGGPATARTVPGHHRKVCRVYPA